MPADSLRFSDAALVVAGEARAIGLSVPGFRSPPRLTGMTRTIQRRSAGAVVSVAVRGRPLADVAADLIEGVLAANGLSGPAAVGVRRRLVAAVDGAQQADRSAIVVNRLE